MTTTTTTTTAANIKIWLGNQAAYNAGYLRGEWVTLPVSDADLQAVYGRIGGEEHFIADYDTTIVGLVIGEYDNIADLNQVAEAIADFDGDQLQALGAYLQDDYDLQDAIGHVADGDYIVYNDCPTMADVAEQLLEDTGDLDRIPDDLRGYFDFATYGRDLELDGTFVYMGDDVYIQLLH